MHAVARLDQAGGGAVEAHVARAAPAGDGVGLEPGAVVDVDDGHLLVLEDVGRVEQVGIDGDRAHVVQVGVGHDGPVDLGLEHAAAHGWWVLSCGGCRHTVTPTLSMSLARPKRTAASSRRFPASGSGTVNESASTTSA